MKFGLPMAFTCTMLSWSVIEYRKQLATSGQLDYALEAIKWATDYFIKAHPSPNVLWGEVGDGYSDHACWMQPEDMTTSRTAYSIDANNPGSELAGETAAAMAAASIAFQGVDPEYSASLLTHARQLFTFADTYRGTYQNSIPIAKAFYESYSGYDVSKIPLFFEFRFCFYAFFSHSVRSFAALSLQFCCILLFTCYIRVS